MTILLRLVVALLLATPSAFAQGVIFDMKSGSHSDKRAPPTSQIRQLRPLVPSRNIRETMPATGSLLA